MFNIVISKKEERRVSEKPNLRLLHSLKKQYDGEVPRGFSSSIIVLQENESSLVCEICGRTYKNRSYYEKHMLEHNPCWSLVMHMPMTESSKVKLSKFAMILLELKNNKE